MRKFPWCVFAVDQIRNGKRLRDISWRESKGDGIAALMVYLALLLHANVKGDEVKDHEFIETFATYDQIQDLTLLSRSKVAQGIRVLEEKELLFVGRKKTGNSYFFPGLLASGWAKLPRSKLLPNGNSSIEPFKAFRLRSKSELHALKLFLLLMSMRNSKSGYAAIGYDKISDYTGISREDISKAISHLINLELVTVQTDSDADVLPGYEGRYNRYQISGLVFDRAPS